MGGGQGRATNHSSHHSKQSSNQLIKHRQRVSGEWEGEGQARRRARNARIRTSQEGVGPPPRVQTAMDPRAPLSSGRRRACKEKEQTRWDHHE